MDRCLFWESCFADGAGDFFHRPGADPAAAVCSAAGDPSGNGIRCAADAAPAAAPRKACHSPGGCVVSAGLGGGTALFFHGSGTGRVSGLLLDGQRPGLSAVPLYPGMRHRAAAAPDLFGSGQAFPAAVPAAVPRCCADLHPVEPEIWTFRQTFSKSIFFFAFTLAER